MRYLTGCLAAVMATLATLGKMTHAQTEKWLFDGEPRRLPEVVVHGYEGAAQVMPDVMGARIYSGKKTSVADLEQWPEINNNNYRQAFSQLPGLLISEMTTPAHVNLNYRGIGDPHESEFVLTLKDGVPIVSDWFGYSTVYYSPPLEAIQRVEFVRGGSSLLYGPQPGPTLNYITHMPPRDRKLAAATRHIFGSDDLYSTFTEAGGTVGHLGYWGYYHHRQADGPRRNADYDVHTGSLKLVLDGGQPSRWIFNVDAYQSESGEAGRLSRAQYKADRDFTRTPFDRIWVERYVPSLTLERDLSEDTLLVVKGWAGYQDRFSRRQINSLTNNLDRQEFYFAGLDTRLRHDWHAWDNDHVATGGFVLYAAHSPRTRERGTPRTADSGTPVFDLDRQTYYGALFAENEFRFGRLALIPALRLELVSLDVREKFNTGVTRPLIDDSFFDVVPLAGLGLVFDLDEANQLYANISQGYRPKRYDDLANPTSNSQRAPSDLKESHILNYELGLRGTPTRWFSYDTSLFLVDYDDFIETRDLGGGNTERANSGRALYYGWEAAAAADLIGLYDSMAGTKHGKRWGSFNVFGNVSLLHAEFTRGNNDGRTPAYAPDHVIKTGAIYRRQDRLKISLTGQLFDEHFWQDNNTAGAVGTAKIAPYMVWDLAVEANLYKDIVTLLAGVNNLFNEDYYARIRSDGIEPAYERNYYIGVKLALP